MRAMALKVNEGEQKEDNQDKTSTDKTVTNQTETNDAPVDLIKKQAGARMAGCIVCCVVLRPSQHQLMTRRTRGLFIGSRVSS